MKYDNLQALADKGSYNIDEIDGLISELKSNKALIDKLGKSKSLDIMNRLHIVSSAYSKLVDFASNKILNKKNLFKCLFIKISNLENTVLFFYEQSLFSENKKMAKRISILEKVIDKNQVNKLDILSCVNDAVYH
tara:strand:+ start:35837 stop:36241 length:405 start_codon:yes stop_codon:yes gene_type:complete